MITTDPYAAAISTLTVTGTTVGFPMIFHKAPGPWTISVSTLSTWAGVPLVSTTSDPVLVHAATPTRLQILLHPGEIANPGKPPYDKGEVGGKNIVSTTTFTSRTSFNLTGNLVDPFFNP